MLAHTSFFLVMITVNSWLILMASFFFFLERHFKQKESENKFAQVYRKSHQYKQKVGHFVRNTTISIELYFILKVALYIYKSTKVFS